MDLLAGWTVAVTSDRRAAEQADLLQRRGADVLLAPVVTTQPVDDAIAAGATRGALAAPVDHVVVTTGIGLRSWVAMAWSWGLGDQVLDLLHGADVWPRGAKAVGALVGEGIEVDGRGREETLDDLLAALLRTGVAGRRIVLQRHGQPSPAFVAALEQAGAEVVEVPIYDVAPAHDGALERLVAAATSGDLDALTLTSPLAAEAVAGSTDLRAALVAGDVRVACVGPVTARAAADLGLPDPVVPPAHRLGSMLRALGEAMAPRGTSFTVNGLAVRHQGGRVALGDEIVRLTPRERRLLEAMLDGRGAVLSKERLASVAWEGPVDAHTVEVTVNRLRRKLGPAATALETTNRRGYRLAV